MTMPYLMNCSHSDNGWCLECVKELWNERRDDLRPCVEQFAREMEKVLRAHSDRMNLPRPTLDECLASIRCHLRSFAGWVDTMQRVTTFNNRTLDTLEEAKEYAQKEAADIANWLMLAMEQNVNEE